MRGIVVITVASGLIKPDLIRDPHARELDAPSQRARVFFHRRDFSPLKSACYVCDRNRGAGDVEVAFGLRCPLLAAGAISPGLPPGSRAIDAFIGEPDMLGIGHGTRFLRPDPDNVRARHAYGRAGFSGDRLVETADGPAALMIFGE